MAAGSPSALDQGAVLDQSIAEARHAFEQALSSPSLVGIEGLLLDSVSLASPTGGEVLERGAAAQWLRERAAAGLRISDFLRHQHLASLVIVTEGWQNLAPISSGRMSFNLHRYDQAGRQDDERGTWKIDVIVAE